MKSAASRLRLMGLLAIAVLACSCSGPCPPGTLARFEKPVVRFGGHNRLARHHVAEQQPNHAVTVVFANLQAQLEPCKDSSLRAVSYASLNFGVKSRLQEPFLGTIRVDFRYAAALAKGTHGSIHACLDGRPITVLPDLTHGRYPAGIQSFELTRLFHPGSPALLELSLHVARTTRAQAAHLGLGSVDVQLLVPPRMARRFKSTTRT